MQTGVVLKWSVILVVLVTALSTVITAAGLNRSSLGERAERMRGVEEATPLDHAFSGFMGTVATSLVGGAIMAIFLRRKG